MLPAHHGEWEGAEEGGHPCSEHKQLGEGSAEPTQPRTSPHTGRLQNLTEGVQFFPGLLPPPPPSEMDNCFTAMLGPKSASCMSPQLLSLKAVCVPSPEEKPDRFCFPASSPCLPAMGGRNIWLNPTALVPVLGEAHGK